MVFIGALFRGRHISGVAQDDGGIAWSFARKRGLEI
jgi:hypothetical protein